MILKSVTITETRGRNPWTKSVSRKGGSIMEKREQKEKKGKKLPKYEPPVVVTYHEDDILEELGPAQACSPDPCPYP